MKNLIYVLLMTVAFSTLSLAQVEESKYFEFLKNAYETKSDDDIEFLVMQFNQFLDVFPFSQKNDEVNFMLAEVYRNDRSYFNALANYLKILFLYPGSLHKDQAKAYINTIISDHEERAFEEIKNQFLSELGNINSNNDLVASYFEYLIFLKNNNPEDLNPIIIKEIDYFLNNFGEKSNNADQALFWQCEIYEKEYDWTEASLSYIKLKTLFPESNLIPQVIYNLSLIDYNELSKPKAAKESFVQLISNYAESEFAGNAQFYLGELYEKEFQDLNEAVTNYRLLVETYPTNKFSVEALKRVAEILIDQEKYEEAISTYYQIVELYPKDKYSPDALMEIKYLYVRRLENYLKAVETLKFFAKQYKDNEDAAENLYDAADMYYDELNNKQAAIDTYHQVINEFPDSKYAEWAKDKIEDLTEE